MSVRVAVNGFGRIGRLVMRAGLGSKDIEFVAVNDLTDPKTLAHLFKYDSIHRTYPGEVKAGNESLVIDGREIKVTAQKDPAQLPWKDLKVDIVIESTGKFTDREGAAKHIAAGAKKVLISAPAKNEDVTLCYGVNHTTYDPAKHHIISNASCTTNCLAPVAKVLHESFGIRRGLMTTVHSYTNDQVTLDFPHKDLRRARAAALSMIPTTTGAAKAVALVLPALKGKLDGFAIRVPTPNVSVVDLTCELEKDATKDAINAAVKAAAEGPLKGVLRYVDEPLVSIDFNGDAHSSCFDALTTSVIDGKLAKILSWYDNEMGFSNRMIDVIRYIAKSL
ncbi:MAG: type I glyceraldehyde-3-phosphate dehydrogenase [bacterium]